MESLSQNTCLSGKSNYHNMATGSATLLPRLNPPPIKSSPDLSMIKWCLTLRWISHKIIPFANIKWTIGNPSNPLSYITRFNPNRVPEPSTKMWSFPPVWSASIDAGHQTVVDFSVTVMFVELAGSRTKRLLFDHYADVIITLTFMIVIVPDREQSTAFLSCKLTILKLKPP